MLVRFRSDVIALKPALVHIMAGTNDVAHNTGPETPEEIEGYIRSMVELALANRIKVVLASIPPAKEFFWHRGLEPAAQIRALNSWLREYAASRGLAYIDYWSVLATTDGAMKLEYSADGVHPNAAGYEAMRPLAAAAIERALKPR
jgi:lysophospholipase L1-like esterase